MAQANTFELDSEKSVIPLGKQLELYRDHEWIKSKNIVPNFGFTLFPQKARLRIINKGKDVEMFFEHRYVHTDKIKINGLTLGDRVSREKQIYPSIYPVFPILIKKGHNEILIEVSSQEIVTLPLYLRKQPPQRDFTWLIILYVISFFCLITILFTARSLASLLYCGYITFFLLNHFLIEGLSLKYFPNVNWSYMMNEGYFLTAISYQLFLIVSIYFFLNWKNLPRKLLNYFKLTILSSVILILCIFVLPYNFIVIPYFINAGLILFGFIAAIIKQIKEGNSLALKFSITWIPSTIGLCHSLYLFFSGQYAHSFGHIVGGILQIILMTILLTLEKRSKREVK